MGRPRIGTSPPARRFTKCSTCGGPVRTDLRGWGPAGARRVVLGAIGNALDPAVLTAAVEKALARLAKRQLAHIERRAHVERELALVQARLDRLVDALADGSLPAGEIKTRLSTEKARARR